jgi:hypothetical protein
MQPDCSIVLQTDVLNNVNLLYNIIIIVMCGDTPVLRERICLSVHYAQRGQSFACILWT